MNLSKIISNTTYDPKAKRSLDSLVVGDHTFCISDRVQYTGTSPCFRGKSGVLKKILKTWLSRRQAGRAGFSGQGGHYTVTVHVLWDGDTTPASCSPTEIS